jgi:hypothetical protein
MLEDQGTSKKALPVMASYSYISFDGTLKDKETVDLIFFYLEHAGGPVNVKIDGHVITVYPDDNVAWLERRHHEVTFKAIQTVIGSRQNKAALFFIIGRWNF